MSADNWAKCPVCTARAVAEREEKFVRAMEVYGKVPLEEFDVLRAEALKPIKDETLYTFREDYEIYLSGMEVIFDYGGHCDVCGSGLSFKDSRPIEVKK